MWSERVHRRPLADRQMAFWQNRSISLVDMYIDNSEPTENVGQIHFSLEYDFTNSTLILKIMQVRTSLPQPHVRLLFDSLVFYLVSQSAADSCGHVQTT